MSRSESAANGRSTRLVPGLAGRSPMVKLSWCVQILEFGGDPAPRHLGEPVEGQPKHRFGSGGRRAEHGGDRLDGGVVVLGLHDDVEELVPPFERAHQRVGDLPACDSAVIVGHGVKRNQRRCAGESVEQDGRERADLR